MSEYAPQVDKSHYRVSSYTSKDRWLSYFHQLTLVRALRPASVLEVGPGDGTVTEALRKDGVVVTTCDISNDLKPDITGSITALPCGDNAYDIALAAEVLEHIEWGDVPQALAELRRVTKQHVVVSVPHPGRVLLAMTVKLPGLSWKGVRLQIPFFYKTHVFNGEHYWELGKKGYPMRHFIALAQEAGLELVATHKYADDPVHRFFIFTKN